MGLVLAITLELREVHRKPPAQVVDRALRLIGRCRFVLNGNRGQTEEWATIAAITSLVEAALKSGVRDGSELAAVLTRSLPASPPRGLSSRYAGSRYPLLRAYALRASLLNQPLELVDLAHDELRTEINNAQSRSYGAHISQEARGFEAGVGALLPWHRLWAETLTGRITRSDFAAAVEDARSASSKALSPGYREDPETSDEIALVWLDALLHADGDQASSVAVLAVWIRSLGRPLFTPTLTRLARVCARTESLAAQALDFVGSVLEILRGDREDAESTAIAYVDLTRAVLTLGFTDARVYFDAAVTVASKFGDEVPDRSSAILHLAQSAGNRQIPDPRLAYELARSAELTHRYVRDKHFDWEGTVTALVGLCPSSAIAILSRWRDRDFGWANELLPILVDAIIEGKGIEEKTAIALTGFRANWNKPRLLEATLAGFATTAEKEDASLFLYSYMKLDGEAASGWRALKQVAASQGVALDGIDELIAFNEHAGNNGKRTGRPAMEYETAQRDQSDWASVFLGLDLSRASDISEAYRRYLDAGAPYYRESFWAESTRRVQTGREPEFIAALAEMPELTLYDLRSILPPISAAWISRPSVKLAFATTLKSFCSSFCGEISKNRYDEVFPFKTACELSGVDEGEFVQVVLSELGQKSELFGARRLFSLVGLLATRLSSVEAAEALSFGLGLYDSVLEDTDADGPWSVMLAPPPDVENAIAGFIWAALASPTGTTRWEAAHVVRGLCRLHGEVVLAHLVEFARRGAGGPFADARFEFYHLHGRQWLLIALARAAIEHPLIVKPHAAFLIEAAVSGERHVLMWQFAARAVLALADQGVLEIDSELRLRLTTVNDPRYPPVERQRSWERPRTHPDSTDEDRDEDRYYFGIDIGPYWMEPLGNCFGLAQATVERAAKRVITVEWGIRDGNRWNEDQRRRRGVYRDHATTHSHGSSPETDDQNFYLSYHAMMTVAGDLLATTPPIHDPDYLTDHFTDWLMRHSVSRDDGNWLADRRDPIPLERPPWRDYEENDEWLWSLQRADFERILVPTPGQMTVFGDWSIGAGSREEDIGVRSALVTTERSEALLRALQTADPASYRIPHVGSDSEIDDAGFRLQGWILSDHRENRLDKFDPWAADISFSPISPAPFVTGLMALKSDVEQRIWRRTIAGSDETVMSSELWGQKRERDDDDRDSEKGKRLQASVSFVYELLRKTNRVLIVCVQISWDFRHTRYGRKREHGLEYLAPSARFFLVRSDGSVVTM